MQKWGADDEGEKVFQQAQHLRQIVRTVAEKLSEAKPLSHATLDELSHYLGGNRCQRIVKGADGYVLQVSIALNEPKSLLWPIAESAADMLCHGDVALVKRCNNPACILYFYDTTKNHARRWCSMATCGNRMKAAAHYGRTRS
jgi:predicted RNA-binding Zn ribbon-like protein